jgi:hypothetical protein
MFSKRAERTQASAAHPLLHLEAVHAVRVDVRVAGRGKSGDVLLLHRLALGPKLLSLGSEVRLAEIAWDRDGLPERVNVKNLTTAKGIALGE